MCQVKKRCFKNVYSQRSATERAALSRANTGGEGQALALRGREHPETERAALYRANTGGEGQALALRGKGAS